MEFMNIMRLVKPYITKTHDCLPEKGYEQTIILEPVMSIALVEVVTSCNPCNDKHDSHKEQYLGEVISVGYMTKIHL